LKSESMAAAKKMNIELVLVSYNRLPYIKHVVQSLFANQSEDFTVVFWDNGSTDGTKEYLASQTDPRISKKVFSKNNVWVHGAANAVFEDSKAELVGILNDDIILSPGWTKILSRAHSDIPELGFIGCWHLGREFFHYHRAKHKIQTFGEHKILRHPWTGGASGLVKRNAWKEVGPFESKQTTNLWLRMAKKGYVNGFYFPLIHVEHMDYVWSQYYMFKDDIGYGLSRSVTAAVQGVTSIEDAKAWHKKVVGNILDSPWDPTHYLGLRNKLRRVREKFIQWKKKFGAGYD